MELNETQQLIMNKLGELSHRSFIIARMAMMIDRPVQVVLEESNRLVEEGTLEKVAEDMFIIALKPTVKPERITSREPRIRIPTAGSSTMPRKTARDYPPLPPEADN